MKDIEKHIKIRNVFEFYYLTGLWWIKFFGYGISWANTKIVPVSNYKKSERCKWTSDTNYLRIGHWAFKITKPFKCMTNEYVEYLKRNNA